MCKLNDVQQSYDVLVIIITTIYISKYYLPLKPKNLIELDMYIVCLIISCVHYVLLLLSHCNCCYCNHSNTRENNTGKHLITCNI